MGQGRPPAPPSTNTKSRGARRGEAAGSPSVEEGVRDTLAAPVCMEGGTPFQQLSAAGTGKGPPLPESGHEEAQLQGASTGGTKQRGMGGPQSTQPSASPSPPEVKTSEIPGGCRRPPYNSISISLEWK